MREILFRGKRLDNGEWVEGYLIVFPKSKRTKIMVWEQADLDFNAIEVNPETIGQYTGLTDKNGKNGKKIFEGDIVQAKIESGNHEGFMWNPMTVAFLKGSFCLTDRKGYAFAVLGAFASSVTFEIIGNIHDNLELLEVE